MKQQRVFFLFLLAASTAFSDAFSPSLQVSLKRGAPDRPYSGNGAIVKPKNKSTWVIFLCFKETNVEKTTLLSLALALVLTFAVPLSADAVMSGGRMGGSFPSAPPSPLPPSSSGTYSGTSPSRLVPSSGSTRGTMSGPNVLVAPSAPVYYYTPRPSPPVVVYGASSGAGAMAYRQTGQGESGVTNALVLGLAGAAVWSSTVGAKSRTNETTVSALGPGATVAQITVALHVSDRNDRNSILSVLDRLAETSLTSSRKGLQDLTSQVALELARRQSSFASCYTRNEHFDSRSAAQRMYNRWSVQERSKFEQETKTNYGGSRFGEDSPDENHAMDIRDDDSNNRSATMAVVTLILAIDGDSLCRPWDDCSSGTNAAAVCTVLQSMASDAQVDECLQSAEILWTPQSPNESLSLRDIVVDYPELLAI